MSTLSAIRKQIQRLEAEAARITREELSGAVAKIKSMMSEYGITLEHLRGNTAPASAKRSASKKSAGKRAGVGQPRYADPKTGKTWSGFGRAPAWIAGAKNRDAFLVDVTPAEPVAAAPIKRAKKAAVAPSAPKAPGKKVAAAKKAVKQAATKATAAAKKAPISKKSAVTRKATSAPNLALVAKKGAASKRVAAKKSARASAQKVVAKSAPRAASSVDSAAAPSEA